jgi:hypothetical protein
MLGGECEMRSRDLTNLSYRGFMKIAVVLLLVVAVAVAAFLYGQHKRSTPTVHADLEAYGRCTAGNDEAHQNEINAGRGGKENDERWLRARAYCRVNLGESLQQVEKDLNAVGLGAR